MTYLNKNDVIGLDRGHGVNTDFGSVGHVREEKIIDEVCNNFADIAAQRGYKVVELRPNDAYSTTNSLFQRVNKAEVSGVTFLLSIHGNSFNGSAHGTEVFCIPGGRGEKIAKQVCDNICKNIGTYNRGVKNGKNLYVLKKSSMTAILVECLFIDNQTDLNKYDPYKIALAIADGMLQPGQAPEKPNKPEKPEKKYDAQIVGVDSYLNVREKPSTNAKVVGKVFPGEKVKIKWTEPGWHFIKYDTSKGPLTKEGYVYAKYIKEI